jgi:hypothetical protein
MDCSRQWTRKDYIMSKKQRRVFWPVLLTALVALGVLAFVAGRPRSVIGGTEKTTTASLLRPPPSAITKSSSIESPSDEIAQPTVIPRPGPVHVVRFTLYDAGIYPREVRVDKGLVAITIEDFSGGTGGLIVAPEIGSDRIQLGVVQRFEHHWRGRSELALTPGRYVVFDSSRPSNRAKLIVEP